MSSEIYFLLALFFLLAVVTLVLSYAITYLRCD